MGLVLSKVQNPGSANESAMVDGWLVCITFGWSIYAVVRKKIPLLWILCCLFSTISRTYIPTRFLFEVHKSFWNLTSAIVAKSPVILKSNWCIFSKRHIVVKRRKFVGNALVAKRTKYTMYGFTVPFMGRIWRAGDRLWTALPAKILAKNISHFSM